MTTIGEALVRALEARGVDTVFGIPGVHTVELYRGLEGTRIRHVTPRHEQGAGFMADGYARISGRPGVAFVITGPGMTNMMTPMGQARADSVPMIVISGVNRRDSLGKGLGHLHELPDQRGMTALVARSSDRIERADDLAAALDRAFAAATGDRPGPAHIEVPIDVFGLPALALAPPSTPTAPRPDAEAIRRAAVLLGGANAPLILAGGGAKFENAALTALAERLGAPVVQTVNARGLMHGHPLTVPASPSLDAVRALIRAADVVLALGTELGPTDYDMYGGGGLPQPRRMIRVDISAGQLARHPADIAIEGALSDVLPALADGVPAAMDRDGPARAAATRKAARAALDPPMRAQIAMLEAVRDTVPGAVFIGDSTQAIYAGNLCYDHDRPAGWFNAATGFGALGYAIPAAIGAALAAPDAPVICLAGDGGAQFTLPEIMTAVDERLPITFLIWNNYAYQEIAASMEAKGIAVVGCHPTPPDFAHIARACGIPHARIKMRPEALRDALLRLGRESGPVMIEIDAKD
ncbi:putative 2-ketoarginine decarboxylase AruI [Defluviimonas aquaemixtae]|uniref:Putative 2-ketoarginine decarboxylase AruI n=1 Tax=Albidovulum aquaemixtae TaxID=1542388 RepID=A0A2R8BL50_9RHOB|nr:5-guanidino-2-oxopentanoate decarboxylase [Defluviimonas aquaemixtae]SPH24116.1 putative 2-ketoarginine decarboxylase AruI [Defluviimonas aquaemixtae]